MKFEYLKWDSAFFNKEISKVNVDEKINNIESFLLQLKKKKSSLYYLFSKVRQPLLEKNKIPLIDIKTIYQKSLIERPIKEFIDIKKYTGKINKQLINLSIESGYYSRFKKDELLSHKFSELYTEWIKKSVEKKIADEVFVAYSGKSIVGVVTVLKSSGIGRIGLIAVGRSYRGKGWGAKLLKEAERWYLKHHLKRAVIVTQKENKDAALLYKNEGYVIDHRLYIYHLSIS